MHKKTIACSSFRNSNNNWAIYFEIDLKEASTTSSAIYV